MRVDANVIAAVAAAINAAVIVIGSFLALRQLKLYRHANELATLTKLAELYDSEAIAGSRSFLLYELATLIEDPSFRAELEAKPLGPRAKKLIPIGDFYEELGTYVFTDALSERTVMLSYGSLARFAWAAAEDAVLIARRTRGTNSWEMFEHFAMCAHRWQARTGDRLDRTLLRSGKPDRWLAVDRARPPGEGEEPA